MATRKLYHEDGTVLETEAILERQEQAGDRWSVVLDRTILFPGGGGQPADGGWIDGHDVIGFAGEEEVLHFLAAPLEGKAPGDRVQLRVDARRRRESAQQHTGQHIVSACLLEMGGYQTVSVHMGEDTMTVESPVAAIPEAHLRAAEERANETICRNLPVRAHLVDGEGLARFNLRRAASGRELYRVVEIEGRDASACAGVHVSRTGEVGLVACVGTEKIRGNCRTIWLAGDRAYRDYARKTGLVRDLGAELSVPPAELLDAARRQKAEVAGLREQVAALELEAGAAEGRRLVSTAESCGGTALVLRRMEGASRGFFRAVGMALSREPRVVALLANVEGAAAQLFACRGEGVDLDIGVALRPHLAAARAKGGGRAGQWQGSAQDATRLPELFAAFRATVLKAGTGAA